MRRHHQLRQTHRRAIWAGITLSVGVHAAVFGLGRFAAPELAQNPPRDLVRTEAAEVPAVARPPLQAVQLAASEPAQPEQAIEPSAAAPGQNALNATTPASAVQKPRDALAEESARRASQLVLAHSGAALTPQLYLEEVSVQTPQALVIERRASSSARSNGAIRPRGPAIRISVGGRGIGGPGCTVTGRGFGFGGRQIVRRF
jgi:hypothetical protein